MILGPGVWTGGLEEALLSITENNGHEGMPFVLHLQSRVVERLRFCRTWRKTYG